MYTDEQVTYILHVCGGAIIALALMCCGLLTYALRIDERLKSHLRSTLETPREKQKQEDPAHGQ